MKIAQLFKAGLRGGTKREKSRRDGRRVLSSLTGQVWYPNREPSLKWLGYCQRPSASLSGLEFALTTPPAGNNVATMNPNRMPECKTTCFMEKDRLHTAPSIIS